ncbi:ornithine cyclodeaminase [Roseovarius sp. TE539]|uniref:ornithine cyclodeaminase family protein n=1 Tax=Roseovarius sp. TE539 TaxID=2249812 RepID=UPI000DDD1145|nr:ornithine cyclodeaminase [Roseovarius sp. TE539]RBI74035.1 ornithine cyclodeaminase [Roseovarius sp. TE539]
MSVTIIPFEEGEAKLDWLDLCAAFEKGHRMPKAEIGDTFLYRDPDTLLSRAAWIDGMGLAVKSATIFPGNPDRGTPMINGGVSLFSDSDGTLEAIVDFHLVTKWKTAGDSLFAATKLARKDSETILIVGAGTVGRSLWQAYRTAFPDARFRVWNRTRANAEAMAVECPGLRVADDLETAVREADIVTSATMSTEPLLKGRWLQPGQHVDLIGAFRPDMREADDEALGRGRIFVDSYDTTLGHIGELKIPLEAGAIRREDVQAEFYEPARFGRKTDQEITLFKNGGGAHLDLMSSRYILDAWHGSA